MKFGSICTGIGCPEEAWRPLGWRSVFMSEIDPFPRAVLKHHHPDVPLHGDFTTIQAGDYDPIDLLVGGTPCQSFSIAGLRGGMGDDRGNLALEYLRLAGRLRPRWLVWENVPGVFSSLSHDAPDPCPPAIDLDSGDGPVDGEEVVVADEYDADESHALSCFLAGLSELGYGFAYRVLDAQFTRTREHPWGVPQRRRRVFVVGYLGDWRRPAAVFFDRESLSGNSAPRREAGKGVTPTISARPSAGGGLGTDFDLDAGLVSSTLNAGGHSRNPLDEPLVAYQATGDAFWREGRGPLAASDDNGTNQIVAFSIMPQNSGKDYKAREVQVAQPVMAAGPAGGNQGGDYIVQPVPFDTTQMTSAANRSNPKAGDPCHPLTANGDAPAIAFALRGREDGALPEVMGVGDTVGTLRAADGGSSRDYVAFNLSPVGPDAATGATLTDISNALTAEGEASKNGRGLHSDVQSAVRRLTPKECSRLQGFPDDFARIPWRGAIAEDCPDGPQYKAYGNSMARNVMAWIGERIAMVEALTEDVV